MDVAPLMMQPEMVALQSGSTCRSGTVIWTRPRYNGFTPLYKSAQNDHLVRCLVEGRAERETVAGGLTPVNIVAYHGRVDMVRYLG